MSYDLLKEVVTVKGPHKLKSGEVTDVYYDFRRALGYKHLRNYIIQEIFNKLDDGGPDFDAVVAVANGGIPWGLLAADEMLLPFGYTLPSGKMYGASNDLEGLNPMVEYNRILLIDDVLETGTSIQGSKNIISFMGMTVAKTLVLLNRNENIK